MAGNVKAPDAGVYGVFSPTYAATLARKQGGGADALNNLALMLLSQGERQGYGDILQATNEQALRESEAANRAALDKTVIEQAANMSNAGILGGFKYLSPNIGFDQGRVDLADATKLNKTSQEAVKSTSEAVKNLAEVNLRPSAEDVGYMTMLPGQKEPVPYLDFTAFDDTTKRILAEAAMINANKPPSNGGGSDGVTLSIADDGFGDPTYTYRGKNPDAVRQAYEAGGGGSRGSRGAATTAQQRLEQWKSIGATWTRNGNVVTITAPSGRKAVMTINRDGSFTEQK